MNIQYITNKASKVNSKHTITFSNFNAPKALDSFDINIFSLQDANIWKYKNVSDAYLDCTDDLHSIKDMINNSHKSVNIIALPQNYTHAFNLSSSGTYINRKELKNEIGNLWQILLPQIIPKYIINSYKLIYENSETILGKSKFISAFCIMDVFLSEERLTQSSGGNKVTTAKNDRVILTTLDLSSPNADFDDFIKGIGLDVEKTEMPEWLIETECFDDSVQKASIAENKAKILELNEQIEHSKERLEENLKYKSILVTNSSELVEVVFEMLEKMLDCSLEDFEDENIEDFLIKKQSITFVGEIKGVTSNVKSEHVAQVDRHYQAYLDRLSEEGKTENVKSLLIMSPFRTKPLTERGEVHENQIHLAKRNGSLIITTDKFLKLYEMFVSGMINSEKIVDIFSSKVGLLEDSDFIQSSTVTTDNSEYVIK